jgi:hypothetical protein
VRAFFVLGLYRLTDKSGCDLVKAYAERIGLKAADFGTLLGGFQARVAVGMGRYPCPRPASIRALAPTGQRTGLVGVARLESLGPSHRDVRQGGMAQGPPDNVLNHL